MIPHAAEQLSPCATTTEPEGLEPVLCNKRSHYNEKAMHHREEQPPLAITREKAHALQQKASAIKIKLKINK